MTDWIARGPDDFGDFTISSQGEELAKCVVVQNGFRTPEETKSIAEQLIKAVNNHDALVKALEEAKVVIRGVVTSYPVAAGTSKYGYEEDHDGYGSIRECRLYLERSGDPVGGRQDG